MTVCLFCFFFQTGFLCVALVALVPVLELALVDQAGLELRDPPASASQMLGLKVCATTAQFMTDSLGWSPACGVWAGVTRNTGVTLPP